MVLLPFSVSSTMSYVLYRTLPGFKFCSTPYLPAQSIQITDLSAIRVASITSRCLQSLTFSPSHYTLCLVPATKESV